MTALSHGIPPSAALALAERQCAMYRDVFRIPVEIVAAADATPTIEMTVCASYSVVSMPARLAWLTLLRQLDVGAIEYPGEERTRVLTFPDSLDPAGKAALACLDAAVAERGSRVRLPVGGNDPACHWIRKPSVPAYFVRLSELAAVAAACEQEVRR
ncbi:hypothetical protein NDR87_31075 [Nocardia sp. CDC159]|uniref:Uncharacterized protein n=1 Tax=Nocardia pulmonis TaxID=2951408 RepID=A0A9X2EGN9_9NOCA|nr:MULTISPECIES: hypothetical protein [Nocardia]MCM6778006.1 hypothetical protein [Nocardia pulmonis]MCM6790823.1 hypothetical protein [Nocardia sp. CDC159]